MRITNIRTSEFYKPLKYFLLYIGFTLSFSFWGPRIYFEYDKLAVFFYILSFLIILILGYRVGTAVKVVPVRVISDKLKIIRQVPFLKLCIALALFSAVINFIPLLLQDKLNLSLTSLGQNYIDYHNEHNANKGIYTIPTIVYFLMGFPKIVTMVLGLYFFKSLNKFYKIGVISVIVLTLLTNTISIGNQKSLGDIVIYTVVVFIVKSLDLTPERRRRLFFKIVMFLILFLVVLSTIQYQRMSALGFSYIDINANMNSRTYFDFDHPFFKIFGKQIGFGLATFITGYLSGGYYGLSLCFKLPFVWTYGIGNSYSASMFAEKFMGFSSVFEHTYLARMETTYGWNGLAAWNTIFPWLASDFTFIGALFLFIPIGYIYAVAWKEIVLYRNPISLLMFAMLTIGLIFIPANNQLLHGVDGFISTIMVFVVWIKQHKKYNVIPVAKPVLV